MQQDSECIKFLICLHFFVINIYGLAYGNMPNDKNRVPLLPKRQIGRLLKTPQNLGGHVTSSNQGLRRSSQQFREVKTLACEVALI